ncbi:hypothetical protein E0500_010335 [Streptomyces sp. KM273126]|uniref:hypothetical protein n=1 Tax=Streptomyces sp. KM273126 TaxID=2545247 RepID=UPI00103DA488|nr:hypothetical protein [Streptomyces sp. KM273126]MBA2807796.1 hypothetical protein [Streptomyces sp. KM273126]
MNRSDRLRPEDKRDYERVLDRALRSPRVREAVERADAVVNTEQLRTKALAARATITAAALPEYRLYLRLRTDVERPAKTPGVSPGGSGADRAGSAGSTGSTGSTGSRGGSESSGGSSRGLLGAVGLLLPALAVMAAIAFLVVGYALRLVNSHSQLAEGLVAAGWIAASVAVLAALLGLVGMLVTASRNRAIAYADHASDTDPAVAAARETWHRALLDRGIQPFLLNRLRATGADRGTGTGTPEGASPDTDANPNPGFSSPGYSSPDYTGSPGYTSPDFTGPDFTGPDFTGPAKHGSLE